MLEKGPELDGPFEEYYREEVSRIRTTEYVDLEIPHGDFYVRARGANAKGHSGYSDVLRIPAKAEDTGQ